MKILSFGEVLWDIYPNQRYIGGAPLNYVAHFVKCGGDAHIISAVGYDDLGIETYEAIKKFEKYYIEKLIFSAKFKIY